MKSLILKVSLALVSALVLISCASLDTNVASQKKLSIHGKQVLVFPFQNPYYKGQQIQGIGEAFTLKFIEKLQAAGVLAEFPKSGDFSSLNAIDIEKACEYTSANGYDMLITGTVTEWLDGATQWSGTVDVAALSVSVYSSMNCELSESASGRQTGTIWTFVNSPTTRFIESLSEKTVADLLK